MLYLMKNHAKSYRSSFFSNRWRRQQSLFHAQCFVYPISGFITIKSLSTIVTWERLHCYNPFGPVGDFLDFHSWVRPFNLFVLICVALFQGYKAWLRLSSYWQNPNEWWGFTLAPWIVISIFVSLLVMYAIFRGGFASGVQIGMPPLAGVADRGRRRDGPEGTAARLWNGLISCLWL
jgi:hypothetical protein